MRFQQAPYRIADVVALLFILHGNTSFGSLAPIIPYRSCKHYLGKNGRELPTETLENRAEQMNAEEIVIGRVSAEVMYRKISELPPRYGAYIQMAYLDKLDPVVIAKVLKVKQDSLRMLGYRARKMLAELCQAESEV